MDARIYFTWVDYTVFLVMLSMSAFVGIYYGLKSKKEETVDDYMLGGRKMMLIPVALSLAASLKKHTYDWVDYTVFLVMLSMSVFVGIYYGLKPKKKEETVEDYMLGGRKMKLIPVALSLAASFSSGISLMGVPSETYLNGTQMSAIGIAISLCYFPMKWFYLPVIYNLQYSSWFEYLERRFDKSTRSLATIVYTLCMVLIVPVFIYIPAIAFQQVSGLSMYVLAPGICGVCIFYTSLGGLKAVVWSDTIQACCTITALIVVIILGTNNVGGLKNILEINERGQRLELFNMDIDPFARNTFWTTTLGSLPTWLLVFAANPSSAQRYISLPTYRRAELSIVLMLFGIVTTKLLCTFMGLMVYAKYHDCDPVAAKQVEKPGQLMPLFVMDVGQDYPGLAGLFMTGVVCTALSTMSTVMNTTAGVIYDDFLIPMMYRKPSDRTANLIMKVITVVLGVITTGAVFFIDKLGTIMQIAVTSQGVTNGISLFMFTFGMFVPWGNSVGVKVGTLAGLATTLWLVFGTQVYIQSSDIKYATKRRSIENCPFNITLLDSTDLGYEGVGTKVFYSSSVPSFYKLSYLYYSLVGLTVAMVVGCVLSLCTGAQDPSKLDQMLLIPQLRRQTSSSVEGKQQIQLYSSVPLEENAIE